MRLPDTGVSGAPFIPGYRDWKDARTSWQLSTWLLGWVDGQNRAKRISAPDTKIPAIIVVHESEYNTVFTSCKYKRKGRIY